MAELEEIVFAEIVEAQDSEETLTPDEAQILTGQIRQRLDEGFALAIVAYRRRAWVALGYPSWDAYCDTEFGALHIKLPREQRVTEVLQMREAGMSLRAISSVTGLGRGTVARDIEVGRGDGTSDDSTVPFGTVESPHQIQGLNGKSYAASAPPRRAADDDLPPEWIDNRPEKVTEPWVEDPILADLAQMSPADAGITEFKTFTNSTPRQAESLDDVFRRIARQDQRHSAVAETSRLAGLVIEQQNQSPGLIDLLVNEQGASMRADAVEELVTAAMVITRVLTFFDYSPVGSEQRFVWSQALQDAVNYLGGVLDDLN